ncbi:MAG: PKD domain-containing protein [Flavobacteriaceae bacterium]|nr:PKD domain-containing protein [Flavobacteriaceae bacterium]
MISSFVVSSCSGKDDVTKPDDNNEEPIDPTVDGDYETLIFTPNESFFSPVGTLNAHKSSDTGGTIYNKNEQYDYIYNWKILTDTIVFGVDIKTAGDLIIKPEMGVSSDQEGSKLLIYLDDISKEITLTSTGSETTYEIQDEVTFENVTTGFHVVKLQLKSLSTPGSNVGNLNKLHLTGPAAKNSENVMRRYRANAVHASWATASNNPVEISVHELTIISKKMDFYQPITTPFGYTGSTWDKDTQTFGGYNFSLWSYGANDPIPPYYQESHLIAVGPGLEFGSYGHEGTGVKPIGDHPYVGIETNTQTIAIRKLPGEIYDTYWSYYLDPTDGHWKLYGCGRTYNESGTLSYLKTGAFVEVPGGANIMRNGHETCETQYRGWQLDTSGNWHPIDKMIGTTGQNNESFRDWKQVGNKFSMQMGGWGSPGIEKKTITLSDPAATPSYLKGAYLAELYKMPAAFIDNTPNEISNRSAQLGFSVSDLGTGASAKIFWGTEEGLTKEDKWQNSLAISVNSGVNLITLDNLEKNTNYFYRIKIKNNEGITWSLDTQKFKTTNEDEPAVVPIASFSSSSKLITKESAITFYDTSTNYPESWAWTFEGGTPSSSVEKTPNITYNTAGNYAVTLTTTNRAGSDTKIEVGYITVTEGGSGTLEAHYDFTGNLLDNTSYHRDLSIVGGFVPTYVSDRNSNSKKAYAAPGESNQYLTNNYKGIGGNAVRSVTAWFKTTTAGTRKTIVSWGKNSEGQMFNVMIHDGRVRVEAGSCSLLSAIDGLDNNAWHHVAVTFNPADGNKLKDVKIYIDGVLDAKTPDSDGNSYRSEVVTINTDITTNNVRIGSASYSSSYYWQGELDDVRIYSDALTLSQILGVRND